MKRESLLVPVYKRKGVQKYSVHISKELHERIRAYARANKFTVQSITCEAVDVWLTQQEAKAK
jgi:hypothetical protein